jgi:hypothetical protein
MSKKNKKDKIVYYDDGSTISDMSSVNKKGQKQDPPMPRRQSTASEKWRTYWHAVKMMIVPMCLALAVIGVLYLLIMLMSGNVF